jgi:hypothetical protein
VVFALSVRMAGSRRELSAGARFSVGARFSADWRFPAQGIMGRRSCWALGALGALGAAAGGPAARPVGGVPAARPFTAGGIDERRIAPGGTALRRCDG